MTKTEQKLSAVIQEIKDFKTETIGWLKKIETQTTLTNSRVTKGEVERAVIINKQDSCPARKYHISESKAMSWGRIGLVIMIMINIVVMLWSIVHATS